MRYLFIDGAFLDNMVEVTKANFGISELRLRYAQIAGRFDRVFYYDAYPERKASQSEEDFLASIARKDALFRTINLTRDMHVRTGISRFRERKRFMQQKGVDILLALDAFKAATRADVDEVNIMTKDLDFFPLFEALRDTSAKAHLHCFLSGTSSELQYFADRVFSINPFSILEYCGADWGGLYPFFTI